jgi:hypothetical protein
MSDQALPGAARCLNCGAALGGPFCAACGQRDEPVVHTVGHFLREATESVTHADSRLWRTLGALLARPGFLTREFFAGRRARYLPPFRLYLVVSLACFVLAAALPGDGLRVSVSDTSGGTPVVVVDAAEGSGPEQACSGLVYEGPGSGWIQPLLTRGCERATRDDGAALAARFGQNLPRALFVFLPLLAAVMMLMYWRPRRHYVEHLLFFVHNHAAAFTALGLYMIVGALLPWQGAVRWLGFSLVLYLLWYLLAAMRAMYGQSRRRTLAKFLLLGFAYAVLGGVTLLVTALYSVVSL